MKKALSVLLALAMFLTMFPSGIFTIATAAADLATGDHFDFGSYPQTKVIDTDTITALNLLTPDSNNDVTYNSDRYRRVCFTQYTARHPALSPTVENSFQDDNGYYINTVYWFKYEPVSWRVLSNSGGELFVMAETVLDSQVYNQVQTGVTWETCTLRNWLNNDFYNTAFSSTEQAKIKTSTVVNDDNPTYGTEGGNNTNDKLFLLSYADSINTAFGFNSSYTNYDPARRALGSDFSKSRGLWVYLTEPYINNPDWWLRSPGLYPYGAGDVYYRGEVDFGLSPVDYTYFGVRPAFKINQSSLVDMSTITFDANGGTAVEPIIAAEGSTVIPPVNPSREGYTFTGWQPEVPATMPVEDMTCVAQWSENIYTITFDANGGTGGTSGLMACGAPLTAPTVTKAGYTFVSWSPVVPATVPAANALFVAQWSVNSYNITFDANGGTGGTNGAMQFGSALKPPTVKKAGYTFAGWLPLIPLTVPATDTTYTAQWYINGYAPGNVFNFGSYPQTEVTDSVTLAALNLLMWDSNGDVIYEGAKYRRVYFTNYKVNLVDTFDPSDTAHSCQDDNGYFINTVYWFKYEPVSWRVLSETDGELFVMAESILDSREMTPNEGGNSWENCAMRSWLSGTFSNAAFTAIERSKISNTNHTNYGQANTTDKLYLLSYDDAVNPAYGFNSNFNTADTARKALLLSDYAKSQNLGGNSWWLRNEIRDGFYRNTNFVSGDGTMASRFNGPRNDSTYIGVRPVFKINLAILLSDTAVITFDANGGTGGTSGTMICADLLTAPTVTRTGYTFAGWSPELPATVPAENTTYTAQWAINSYTFTYDSNGGTAVEPVTQEYQAFVAVPANLVRAGYTFCGWSPVIPLNIPAENRTFTAQWRENGYAAGQVFTYGSYPQTKVTDADTITALNLLTRDANNDVTYNGEKYRRVYFTSYIKNYLEDLVNPAPEYSVQDDNGYFIYTVYWFKYEPITWRVLSETNGDLFVMSESILDSKEMTGQYGNSWRDCRIRSWLNSTFSSTAFTAIERSKISNSVVTGVNQPDTVDKLFLLSYNDAVNTAYGFNADCNTADPARQGSLASDYAKCSNLSGGKHWWLRVEIGNNGSRNSNWIQGDGKTTVNNGPRFDATYMGVRPVFKINLDMMLSSTAVITFDANGGTGGTSETTMICGNTLTPPTVTKTGYTFAGWSPEAPATVPAENTTYTAQWTINSYTFSYDSNGGTAVEPVTQNYQSQVAIPANPTRAGYTFTGWLPVIPNKVPAENRSFTAQWRENGYAPGQVFTYGSYPQTKVTDADTITALNLLTRDANNDVVYDGAKYRRVYFTNYTVNLLDEMYPIDPEHSCQDDNGYFNNTAYWFKYEPVSWRVLSETNGDLFVMSESILDSREMTPNQGGWTWINCQMRSWLSGTFTNTAFTAYERTKISNTDHTNYGQANTTDKLYVLSYDDAVNPAYGFNSNFNTADTARKALLLSDYAKSRNLGGNSWWLRNEIRDGFYRNTNFVSGDGTMASRFNGPRFDATYIGVRPVFKINLTIMNSPTAVITFDANGGTGGTGETTMICGNTLTPPTVTKTGYTFAGWSPEAPATVPEENTTYTAQWAINSYTFSYDSNGGTAVEPVTQNYQSQVAAPANPTRAGYTFTGWLPVIPNKVPAENRSFTAQWRENGYAPGQVFTYGSYPQTKVTDTDTITALNLLTRDANNDVIYEGTKYRRVYFTQYKIYETGYTNDPSLSYQDDNGYFINTVYWFKYEPISWRVLSNTDGNLYVMSESILNAREMNTYLGGGSWSNRPLRSWLNGTFCSNAFTTVELSKITTSNVLNGNEPTTSDKLFFLSHNEAINPSYGFNADYNTADPARQALLISEYSKCCNLAGNIWWLRSTCSNVSYGVNSIGSDGKTGGTTAGYYVDQSYVGVRPVFKINLAIMNSTTAVITFDANGGTGGTSATMICADVLTAPTVTRTGYTFTGWSPEVPASVPIENTTYTAQWTINSYTFFYDSNGGTAVDPVTQNYQSQVAIPANPTRAGYTFTGWLPVIPNKVPAENRSFTAQWRENGYAPGQVFNYGSYPQTKVTDTDTITALNLLTRDANNDVTYNGDKYRWVFFEHYKDADPEDNYQLDNGYFVNTTYWFKYEPISWRVLSNTDDELYVMSEGLLNAREIASNYGILSSGSWSVRQMRSWLDSTFINTAFSTAEQSRIITSNFLNGSEPSTENKISLLSLDESFNPTLGFSSAYNNPDAARQALLLSDYSKCNGLGSNIWWLRTTTSIGYAYHFIYSDGTTSSVSGGLYHDTSRVGVRPVFRINLVDLMPKITFDSAGGSQVAAISQYAGTPVAAPENPVRSGYAFNGWLPEIPSVMPASDLTCTAQWQANTYEVAYDGNGNTGGTTLASAHTYGTALNLTVNGFTKDGFGFAGWSADPQATTVTYTDGQSVQNIAPNNGETVVLYAVWAEPGSIVLRDGSTAVIDQSNGFIYGLAPGTAKTYFEGNYVHLAGNYRFEYSSSAEYMGTGTKVNLIDNTTDEILKTYTIVIFGDVNGDGNIDSIDAGAAVDFENYMITWDPVLDAALYFAGDVNGDGNIDSIDAGIAVDAENYIVTIDQVTGLAVFA